MIIQYTEPGESYKEILDFESDFSPTKPKPDHEKPKSPTQAPANGTNKKPSSSDQTIKCPCFQKNLLSDDNSSMRLDKDKSCKLNSQYMMIYFHEVNSGGFKINDSFKGFEVDIRGDKLTCTSASINSQQSKSISQKEGEACISYIKEACIDFQGRLDNRFLYVPN